MKSLRNANNHAFWASVILNTLIIHTLSLPTVGVINRMSHKGGDNPQTYDCQRSGKMQTVVSGRTSKKPKARSVMDIRYKTKDRVMGLKWKL